MFVLELSGIQKSNLMRYSHNTKDYVRLPDFARTPAII